MKNILLVTLLVLSLASCKKKDYVTLEVKLDGLEKTDTVATIFGSNFKKDLKIDANGFLKDTFKIGEAGNHGLFIKDKQIQMFLRNGYELTINGDIKKLDSTLVFKGKGAVSNNYLVNRLKIILPFVKESQALVQMTDSAAFNKKVKDFENTVLKYLADTKKLDTLLVKFEKDGLNEFVQNLKLQFTTNYEMSQILGKGKPSPKFVGYENYKGGKTSLDDLKGKFVYIDVWATWCQPCLAEIPDLKALEEEYRNKNIYFVSISTDKKADHGKWKDMVKSKDLKGVQLYFGEELSFMEGYRISSIPRFILIDPQGNIVESNAPRPSEKEKIRKLFTEAGVK